MKRFDLRTIMFTLIVALFLLTCPALGGDALFINENGNVGIGTTNPAQKLEVSGNSEPLIRITNTGMSGSPTLDIGMNNGNNAAIFQATNGKDFKFYNGQYALTILGSNGNVGIGTTNPAQKLEVSGNSEPLIRITNTGMSGSPTLDIGMNNGNNAAIFQATNGKDFKFYNGQYALTILGSNGNVGIGTTNPSEKLYVVGNIYATGSITPGSSRDLKDDIRPLSLEEAVSTLKDLTPTKYRYKADRDEEHLGFIAEDVPALVATKDRKGLSPMDIVAVLTKVVQKQQQEIEALKAQLNLK